MSETPINVYKAEVEQAVASAYKALGDVEAAVGALADKYVNDVATLQEQNAPEPAAPVAADAAALPAADDANAANDSSSDTKSAKRR